jgi:hypothetical protein
MKRAVRFAVKTPSSVLLGAMLILSGCDKKDDQPKATPSSSTPQQTVTLQGRVVLKGTPPTSAPIAFDANCGKLHSSPVMNQSYLVGNGGGLAEAFVYVKAGLEGTFIAPTNTPLLDQIDCIYTPNVMGVMTGQTFLVRNSDALMHNVHSLPKPGTGNKERNVAQPVKGMKTPFVAHNPEVLLKFRCDVHPWMSAYVGVVEHPFFAVTDKDGNFTIANLPSGKYTIAAVHPKAGETTQSVDASAAPQSLEFTLTVPGNK